ncbi:MAG: Gldg family protein, partial [Clostridia bacterium]|nr:Gldg family protein [Clostridia bacterium]
MNFLRKKSFQYGTAAIVLVAIVLALVVIFNVLLSMFSDHFGWYADISSAGLFRFSEESLSLLDTIDGENNRLTLYYLADKNTMASSDYGNYILGLTTELENRYDFISVEFVDDLNKDILKIAAIYGEKYLDEFDKRYKDGTFTLGTMILRNDTYEIGEDGNYIIGITGEKQADYRVSTFTVNDMYSETTSAFLGDFLLTGRIMGICRQSPDAYFLTGHGNLTIADDGDFGNASVLSDLFLNCGYTVHKLNLSEKDFDKSIREASVAVIFAPRVDLTEGEIARLSDFVSRGGNVMFFADGDYYRLDKLTAFLEDYGITVANAKIKSPSQASLGNNGFSFAAEKNTASPVIASLRDKESKMALDSCRLLRVDAAKGA